MNSSNQIHDHNRNHQHQNENSNVHSASSNNISSFANNNNTNNSNNIFLERTRIAVAKAKLADELEIEVQRLRHELHESQERETHSKEKLQLFVSQFKTQTEQVKVSAAKALTERERLELETEQLRAKTQKQESELEKLKKELDIALMIKRTGSISPPSQERNNNNQRPQNSNENNQNTSSTTRLRGGALSSPSSFQQIDKSLLLLSPPPPGTNQNISQISNIMNDGRQQQQQQHREGIFFASPPPLSPSGSFAFHQENNNSNSNIHGSEHLLHQRRSEKKQKTRGISVIEANSDGSSTKNSSIHLAARIAIALFSQNVKIEPLDGHQQQHNNSKSTSIPNTFRVGQLSKGWWKYSVVSIPLAVTNSILLHAPNKNNNFLTCLSISVLASNSMKNPPPGTLIDYSFPIQLVSEIALTLSLNENCNNNKKRNSPSSISALEYLSSWISLSPFQLHGVSLVNRNEFENVLEHVFSNNNNSENENKFSSVLYLTNVFNRRECFIVDSCRIGMERLCCCVFSGENSNINDNDDDATTTTEKKSSKNQQQPMYLGSPLQTSFSNSSYHQTQQQKQQKQSSSSSPIFASWLTIREIREIFASCVKIDLFPRFLINDESELNNNNKRVVIVERKNNSINNGIANFVPRPLFSILQQRSNRGNNNNNNSNMLFLHQMMLMNDNTNNINSAASNDMNNNNFFLTLLNLQNQNFQNNLQNQTEIRFPCFLKNVLLPEGNHQQLPGGSKIKKSASSSSSSSSPCKDTYITIRNINANCGIELIETWISQFSVDFFIADAPVYVMKLLVANNNNQSIIGSDSSRAQQQQQQTLLLRADIASPGQIRWSFCKNDEKFSVKTSMMIDKDQIEQDGEQQQKEEVASEEMNQANKNSNKKLPNQSAAASFSGTLKTTNTKLSSSPNNTSSPKKNDDQNAPASKNNNNTTESSPSTKNSKNDNNVDSRSDEKRKPKLTSIVIHLRCTDSKTVARAANAQSKIESNNNSFNDEEIIESNNYGRFCSAVCTLRIPPPPPILFPVISPTANNFKNHPGENSPKRTPTQMSSSSKNHNMKEGNGQEEEQEVEEENFSCLIPNLSALTIHTTSLSFDENNEQGQNNNEENAFFFSSSSSSKTFQINGETIPSSTGSLRLVASRKSSSRRQQNNNLNSSNRHFLIFPLEWSFVNSSSSSSSLPGSNFISMMNNPFHRELLEASFLSPINNNQSKQPANKNISSLLNLNNNNNNDEPHQQQDEMLSLLKLRSRLGIEGEEVKSMKQRAYEVFGIGLAAAEAWMSAASSWMTRFNAFKALLLFESCRASEVHSLKQAAWLRRTLLMPIPLHSNHSNNNSPAHSSSNVASPSQRINHSSDNNGNAQNEIFIPEISPFRSKNQNSSSLVAVSSFAADRWAQYMLIVRFCEWMTECTDLFAWSFDAVVSSFFDALHENRLNVGATQEEPLKTIMSANNVKSGSSGVAVVLLNERRRIHQQNQSSVARQIFSSPCSADGGDEFLVQSDWENLSLWQQECARARFELLLHWGDAVTAAAAESFAESTIMFQNHINEMMKSSRMEVFARKVGRAMIDLKRNNNNNNRNDDDDDDDEYEPGILISSLKMRIGTLEQELHEERMLLKRHQSEEQHQQQQLPHVQKNASNVHKGNGPDSNKINHHHHHYSSEVLEKASPPSSPEDELLQSRIDDDKHKKDDFVVVAVTKTSSSSADRCAALELECEALALRLDASEKYNLAQIEKNSLLQSKLEQTLSESKDYIAELHRLRSGIDQHVKLAVELETRNMQKEILQERSNANMMKREVQRRDEIIAELQKRLEKEQKERMSKYSEMLKEFSSGTALSPVPVFQQQQRKHESDDEDDHNFVHDSSSMKKEISAPPVSRVLGDRTNRIVAADFADKNQNNHHQRAYSDSLERVHHELGRMIQNGPDTKSMFYFDPLSSLNAKDFGRSKSMEEREDLQSRNQDEERRKSLFRKLEPFSTISPPTTISNNQKSSNTATSFQDKNTTRRSTSAVTDMQDIPTSFLMEQFGAAVPASGDDIMNRYSSLDSKQNDNVIHSQNHQNDLTAMTTTSDTNSIPTTSFSSIASINNMPNHQNSNFHNNVMMLQSQQHQLPTRQATEKLMMAATTTTASSFTKEKQSARSVSPRHPDIASSTSLSTTPKKTTSTSNNSTNAYSRLYQHAKNNNSNAIAASIPQNGTSSSSPVTSSSSRPKKILLGTSNAATNSTSTLATTTTARPKRF